MHQEPNGKRYKGYQITTDGLMLYNNTLYVPSLEKLKHLIMDEFHKRPYVGHPGYQKMVTIVRKLYYYPRMIQDIV
jgi:hypothetical protein